MSILSKAIDQFTTILIKLPMAYFRYRTNISKIYMEPYMIPNRHSNFEKEEQSRRDHKYLLSNYIIRPL